MHLSGMAAFACMLVVLAVVHWLPVSKAEPPPAPVVQPIPEPAPLPPVEQSAELSITREQLEIITRAAGVGIWDWDLRSGRIAADLHMTQKLDAAAHDFTPDPMAFIRRRIHAEDVPKFERA